MDKNKIKKVLLLDTNVSSYPIYQFLLKNNYDTYVIGSNPNDCLAKISKNYINYSYSSPTLFEDIIQKYSFDALIPGCNDVSYISATLANKNNTFFGLDTIKTTQTINNKLDFRKFAHANNLSVPIILNDEESILFKKPIIIKPTDAYSGRGVTILNTPTKISLTKAINLAKEYSSSNNYIIEEYVEGQLYSHTAFIINKKIIKDFIVIEDGTSNKFTVDSSYVVFDFSKQILKEIRREIEIISDKLNLTDGLFHTQFIKQNNKFKIIEVTRRCPGDLYSMLIQKSTEFDYTKFYVEPFLGKKFKKNKLNIKKHYIIRHTLSLTSKSNIVGIQCLENLKIDTFIPMCKTGDEIKQSPFGRIAIAFLNCKNKKELKKFYSLILNRKLFNNFDVS